MGLEILIRGMAILRWHVPEALLLIGGTGSLRDDLESLTASLDLNDRVRFLGFVPDEQLPLYYQAADLFVLPTRELEGFGLVTVEALACGTPVLGTPVGATPEILHPLDPALVFRDTTPEAMAEDLRRVLADNRRDPLAGKSTRLACRQHAKAHFTWDQSVARLEDTLGQIVERRGGSPEAVQACPTCADPIRAIDLCYLGTRYLRCARCQTGAVAAFPTAASLRHRYETEYVIRYRHEWVAVPRLSMFVSMLDRLGKLCQPGRLLDVGCGGGYVLEAASHRGWRGLGTDLSYQACAVVRDARGLPVIQAESAEMPVRDACMDAVAFVNVLDHVSDPLGALREAYRVLTPGGYLMIRIPNAAFHRPWVRLLTSLGPVVRWYGVDGYPILHLYAFTPGGLRRLVERARFRVLEVRNSPLAAEEPSWSQVGFWGVALGCFRGLIAAGAVGMAVLSRGQWLLGPSIELYAKRPPTSEGRDL
jgi:SAM-dependent methyltransferase